jgi:hypothetical protein
MSRRVRAIPHHGRLERGEAGEQRLRVVLDHEDDPVLAPHEADASERRGSRTRLARSPRKGPKK